MNTGILEVLVETSQYVKTWVIQYVYQAPKPSLQDQVAQSINFKTQEFIALNFQLAQCILSGFFQNQFFFIIWNFWVFKTPHTHSYMWFESLIMKLFYASTRISLEIRNTDLKAQFVWIKNHSKIVYRCSLEKRERQYSLYLEVYM